MPAASCSWWRRLSLPNDAQPFLQTRCFLCETPRCHRAEREPGISSTEMRSWAATGRHPLDSAHKTLVVQMMTEVPRYSLSRSPDVSEDDRHSVMSTRKVNPLTKEECVLRQKLADSVAASQCGGTSTSRTDSSTR